MTEDAAPPTSRWEVQEHTGSPTGGLYELEIKTTYRVVQRTTGAVVLSREGLYEASFGTDGNWGEGTTSGVVGIQISPDDRFALIEHAGGEVERVALPAPSDN